MKQVMQSCNNSLNTIGLAILQSKEQKYVLELDSIALDVTKMASLNSSSSLRISSKYGTVTYNLKDMDIECISFVVSIILTI